MPHDDSRLRLYLANRTALVDYATPLVGDRARAEDVVQEAYLRFVPSGTSAERPLAYLYRIVRNLALDLTRRRALERRSAEGEPSWWMAPATPRTPEQQALLRDQLERVEAALSELAPKTRLALEMHRLDGHSLHEIANRLGVSVPTAHRLVRDALVRVALRLDPVDPQP